MKRTRKITFAAATLLATFGVACSTSADSNQDDTLRTPDAVDAALEAAADVVPDTTPPTTAPPTTTPPTTAPPPTVPEPEPELEPEPEPELEPEPEPEAEPEPEPEPELELVAEVETPTLECYVPDYDPVSDGATSVLVDTDGDGVKDDIATSYLVQTDDHWRLRLETGEGVVSDTQLSATGAGALQVLGGIHTDGDGTEEILAVVGYGPHGPDVGVFGPNYSGCITRLVIGSHAGPDTRFEVGHTAEGPVGLQCADGFIESMSAVSNGDGTSNVYGTTFTLVDEFVMEAAGGTHAFAVPDDDPLVAGVPTVDCPGITL